MRYRSPSIVGIVWIVVGLVLASRDGYLEHLDALMPILSAVLAVLLWPLLLLGINLHVH
jgi:hypothetical protein